MSSSAYLLVGDEYLVSAKAKEIIGALVPPQEAALGLEVVDGSVNTVADAVSALRRCIEAAQTIGLLGGRKVVWLQDAGFLGEKTLSGSESIKLCLEQVAGMLRAGLPTGHVLIITASGLDQRSVLYKACKEVGKIHDFSIPNKDFLVERDAAQHLRDMLAAKGLRMDENLQEIFLEKVGTETWQIASEIEKLAVFIGDRKEAQLADVEAVTSALRTASVWELADAVGRRELGRAIKVLRRCLYQREKRPERAQDAFALCLINHFHTLQGVAAPAARFDVRWLVTSAFLNGTLTSTGWAPTTVHVYWGTEDGTTNRASWAHTNDFGVQAQGPLTTNVTGLSQDTLYYYRFYATNADGEVWASSSQSFTTYAQPAINNGWGAGPVSFTTATLSGNLTSGTFANVYIYWGQDTNNWANTNTLGNRAHGVFFSSISGLSEGSVYYYRCYATNYYGEAWSADTVAFTTLVSFTAWGGGNADEYDEARDIVSLSPTVKGTVFSIK